MLRISYYMTIAGLVAASGNMLFGSGLAYADTQYGTAVVQRYPERPVRMIIPLAPGGGSDIVGRIVAGGLAAPWQQTVVVDNRPGAGSAVGTGIAARAPADGHTLLVSSSSMAITPALYERLAFDIQRDFDPVTLIASQPSILAVHPAVAAASVGELLALVKTQPGKLAFASAGHGSATHLGTELLQHAAGLRMLHVPYKSAGQATTALLAGESQVLLTNMASLLPHVRSGRIRALGVSSVRRSALAPEVPTIAESGVPGFEYQTWYGMLVPAGTPKAVVQHIQRTTAAVIQSGVARQQLTGLGLTVYGTSPSEFNAYLADEIGKWRRVVRRAGVRME
jgi:tripartite-type tricarboxylate transporter receptor subunit TctC